MDHIAIADSIATAAHAGQLDKAGLPYLGHVRRVAVYVDPANAEAAVAALLHDVIEDSGITAAQLAEQGIPASAIDAVERLTRRDHVSPDDYYRRIREHPIAREVKLADLADNTDPERMANLSDADRARLTSKYAHAYQALGADFGDGAERRARANR